MKLILKSASLIICISLCFTIACAQTSKKLIVGIWELSQANTSGQPLLQSPVGYLKIYNADGTFTNVQVHSTGAIISHSGKYRINNDQFYTETPLRKREEFTYVPVNKPVKINYKFSDDKKWLTLNFTVPEGTSFTEVWRRL